MPHNSRSHNLIVCIASAPSGCPKAPMLSHPNWVITHGVVCTLLLSLRIITQIDRRIRTVVVGDGAADVCKLGWALHAAKDHPRIVSLAAILQPLVPIIAPLAA